MGWYVKISRVYWMKWGEIPLCTCMYIWYLEKEIEQEVRKDGRRFLSLGNGKLCVKREPSSDCNFRWGWMLSRSLTNQSINHRHMIISLNMQSYVLLRCIQYIDNWAQLSCIDLLRFIRPSQVLLEPNLQFKVRAWSCLEDQYQKRVSELVYMYICIYTVILLISISISSSIPLLFWILFKTVPLAWPFWKHPEIRIIYGT